MWFFFFFSFVVANASALVPTQRLAPSMVSKADAEKVIALATRSISRDATVQRELGTLQKVQNVLGFGSPAPGAVAVSFNASFRRKGSSFITMGGEKKQANRGTTVGKVQAKTTAGKLVSVVISKDGGWGKSINVAV